MILARVSSSEQKDDGYGLSAQVHACRQFAKAEGIEVVEVHEEDARSTVLLSQRKGGRAALDAMLLHGAGVLLLARRDRLARDPYVAGDAERTVAAGGGRILYADGSNGTDDGALLLNDMQHAIAAHERRAIVARLKAGREAKAREKGPKAYTGGRPAFGYKADPATRELVVDDEAAEVVRRAFGMVRDGSSIRAVAEALSAEGVGGRRWHPTAVARLLSHEQYKQAHPGRIVDPKVYNAAQRALAARRRGA
ncbi:recombinase family protein [Patulibacter sp.]|uniref:recombinase family protein n=1 Tax=Patulibacter sp. TaxID=1912859 RepID=UPI0027204E51|nr:recombinase family protein [Patulibacter sp.]MDO9409712.1 recombinase family protein [Patulibacter sp.]